MGKIQKMPQNFSEDAGQNLQVMHSTLYNHQNWPKSSSGKVLISVTMRMIAIDQLILLLSIPKMQNLARKGKVFEVERVLIIISNDFKHIEKRKGCLRVVYISRSQMFQKMGMKGRPPSIWGPPRTSENDIVRGPIDHSCLISSSVKFFWSEVVSMIAIVVPWLP